ncbi:fimbrial protein [Caballeronia sp. DA-9]|uniref:fimbrial protein n=1 Tax=Caballeronia sp. DA-9 TaxID=3436237 RepID=UPI003F67F799
MNADITIPTNVFPRDAAINTQSAPYSTTVVISCMSTGTAYTFSVYTYAPSGVAVPGFTNYYQTNLPDVAVRYIAENGPNTKCTPYSGGWPSQMLQIRRTISCTVTAASPGVPQIFNLKYSAYFMKVGPAPTGNLTAVPPVTIEEYQPESSAVFNVYSGVATGSFAVSACSVTTPAIAVTMPKTYTYRLPKVGSTDGETNLNVGLNCDPGLKVYTTLTDVSTPANDSTTLSLSPESTARGIGYQILFNGVPIVFGPDSAVVGNRGQFLMTPTQTTGGVVTVPLTARYIRTGTIGTGSANAKATFTMSYQ